MGRHEVPSSSFRPVGKQCPEVPCVQPALVLTNAVLPPTLARLYPSEVIMSLEAAVVAPHFIHIQGFSAAQPSGSSAVTYAASLALGPQAGPSLTSHGDAGWEAPHTEWAGASLTHPAPAPQTSCLQYLDARNTPLLDHSAPFVARALRIRSSLAVLHLENASLSGRPLMLLGEPQAWGRLSRDAQPSWAGAVAQLPRAASHGPFLLPQPQP